MSITDRIEPKDSLDQFLLEYELQRLAFIKTLDFVKQIVKDRKCDPNHAEALLKELGERI